MSLTAIGQRIQNGKLTYQITLVANQDVSGKVTGVSVNGNYLVVETDDGKRVTVPITKFTAHMITPFRGDFISPPTE